MSSIFLANFIFKRQDVKALTTDDTRNADIDEIIPTDEDESQEFIEDSDSTFDGFTSESRRKRKFVYDDDDIFASEERLSKNPFINNEAECTFSEDEYSEVNIEFKHILIINSLSTLPVNNLLEIIFRICMRTETIIIELVNKFIKYMFH